MSLRTLHQENIGIIKEQTTQINLILLTLLITKKLKIDYKINSVSAELDENGNLTMQLNLNNTLIQTCFRYTQATLCYGEYSVSNFGLP